VGATGENGGAAPNMAKGPGEVAAAGARHAIPAKPKTSNEHPSVENAGVYQGGGEADLIRERH